MAKQKNTYKYSNFGNNVVDLRESRDFSQTHLADLLNLNKNVLGRIERGERPLRDVEILKLAEIFKVSTDLILDNKTEVDLDEQEKFLDYQRNNQKDISKQIPYFIEYLEREPGLTFEGRELSREEKKDIAVAFEVVNRLIGEKLYQK
ncbi:helix-turn-helix domain-containing protein [Enterococcus sp. RIT-PI-f]|uniref:helix-turn-helix domain-containing protein n=1 Tax=Enterococcus sp. RIT-PI-f TaxID=1690244 RepID=UPI0006B9BBB1|nr:helix-turn-helix transcriptional regulator [Enterococcus sp. RIT-PI-f]KPG72036.1 XRE family transcriptional regulator [Enterococcus sp. RIT-PI-f]